MILCNLFLRRGKVFLYLGFALVAVFAFCLAASLACSHHTAEAATTYTVYFHRDFSNVKTVAAKKSTTKITTSIKSLYQPNNASGTLAKYATYKDCHYLYYRNSSGNFKYFVYAKAQSKYPLGSMSVKNCRSQGYSISNIMSLSGIKNAKTLHIYLAYKQQAHSYKTKTQATCAKAGQEACSICGYARTVAATGKHNYKTDILPTCAKAGQEVCSTCSATRLIAATGKHSYQVKKQATCVEAGQEVCSICLAVREISATGKHAYKLVQAGSGKHQMKCSMCGKISAEALCAPSANGKCITCGAKLKHGAKFKCSGGKYIATSSSTVTYCGPVKSNVASITIPSQINYHGVRYKVTKIKKSACAKLQKLKNVIVQGNVLSIGSKAFYGCKKLKKFKCNSSVLVKIGANAFKDCKKLKIVIVSSEKLSSLGVNAFKGCKSLRRFTYKSTCLSKSKLRKAGVLR